MTESRLTLPAATTDVVPHLTANGLSLYYELHGEPDAPHVLLISGTGNDLRTSAPDRSPLNKAFRVAHYDQRGLGQSDKPPGPHEMADYADDAAAVIEALGWDRCHVVGASFGGMVAMNLAIRHPDTVDRLVLCCTSPGGTQASFPLDAIADLDVEARVEMLLGLYDNRWDPGQDDPIPGLGRFYDRYVAGARRERTGDDLIGYRAQLDARSRHDVQRRLGSISATTLVCAGEFDDLAPLTNSMALVEGIADSRLRVFDGGHLFLLQDRTAWSAIVAFLQDELDNDQGLP